MWISADAWYFWWLVLRISLEKCPIHYVSDLFHAPNIKWTCTPQRGGMSTTTRNSRTDSNTDSKLSFKVESNNAISLYQPIFELTQSLSFRCYKLTWILRKNKPKQPTKQKNNQKSDWMVLNWPLNTPVWNKWFWSQEDHCIYTC